MFLCNWVFDVGSVLICDWDGNSYFGGSEHELDIFALSPDLYCSTCLVSWEMSFAGNDCSAVLPCE